MRHGSALEQSHTPTSSRNEPIGSELPGDTEPSRISKALPDVPHVVPRSVEVGTVCGRLST